MEELFYQLQDKYEDYKPNDEDFLEEFVDLQEEIERLDSLNPATDEEFEKGIRLLVNFLYEWFPDSVDEEEQEELKALLQSASDKIKM